MRNLKAGGIMLTFLMLINKIFALFYMSLPIIILVIGIVLIVKKINRPIGIALLGVPAVLFSVRFISTMSGEYYYYVVMPRGTIIAGVLLIIAGVLEWRKRREKQKFFLPVTLIIIGVFSLFSFHALMITYFIADRVSLNESAKKYPISAAFFSEDIRKLEAVLESGADLYEIVEDKSILQRLLLYGTIPLTDAQLYEKIKLLVAAGYDVNEKGENGETLLMLTNIDCGGDYANYDQFNMPSKLTELFISCGADVNAADDNGRTALMWACSYKGYYYMYDIDKNNSPLIQTPIDSVYYNMTKRTSRLHYNQIKALVEAGADVLAQDNKGFTALDYFEFAMKLNSMHDRNEGVAFYQSQEYIESCKAIKELLQ